MKKTVLFLLCITASISAAYTQSIRLNAYGTGVFDDKVDSYYSPTNYFKGKVNGGLQWGPGLEFRLHRDYGIELMYLRQDTKAPIEYYDQHTGTIKHTNFDLALNYLMIGGVRSVHPTEKIEPYGGFMLGIAIINAKNPDNNSASESTSKFAWGLRGGVNIWVSKSVGIKLQTQLLSISQAVGGGLFFGTGGAGAGVTTYSSMLQFGLGAGLSFKLPKK